MNISTINLYTYLYLYNMCLYYTFVHKSTAGIMTLHKDPGLFEGQNILQKEGKLAI